MAKLLKGKDVISTLNEETKQQVENLKKRGINPKLAIIRVGEKDSDISYERGAAKRAESIGIEVEHYRLEETVSQTVLIGTVRKLNMDDSVHGVLILRPLPKHIDDDAVRNALDPAKDSDGITDISIAGVFSGTNVGFPPCTPSGCIEILDHYGIEIAGKKAVIIGRSMVVGKPLAMMLLKRNATVTVCHTKTGEEDLKAYCQQADLIFVTTGVPKTLRREHVKEGQIIIDIGIHVGQDGKLCGDVDFAEVEPVAEAITPVPGGVGTTTSSILMRHLVIAAKRGNING